MCLARHVAAGSDGDFVPDVSADDIGLNAASRFIHPAQGVLGIWVAAERGAPGPVKRLALVTRPLGTVEVQPPHAFLRLRIALLRGLEQFDQFLRNLAAVAEVLR